MGVRAPWQDQFLICQAAAIDTAKDFLITDIGLALGDHALPLDSHPHLFTGQSKVVQRKTTGDSAPWLQTAYETVAGTRLPAVTLEMGATPQSVSLFMWLLSQNGSTEGGSPQYQKVFTPWTLAAPEIYCNAVRAMSAATADSYRIRGGVCRSVTISGSQESQVVKISAELVGAYIDHNFDMDAAATVVDMPAVVPFMFNEFSIVNYNLSSFSFTFANGVVPKHYSSVNPEAFVLGDCAASAEIVVSWGSTLGGQTFQSFVKGLTGYSATVYTAETDTRYLGLKIVGYLDDMELVEDGGELSQNMKVIGAEHTDLDAFEVKVNDGVNRGIT